DHAKDIDKKDEEIELIADMENIDSDGDEVGLPDAMDDNVCFHGIVSTLFTDNELSHGSSLNNASRTPIWNPRQPELSKGLIFKSKTEL
ncbi:unnamed protein product, partial [Ilex paraguariensis]